MISRICRFMAYHVALFGVIVAMSATGHSEQAASRDVSQVVAASIYQH